MTITRQRFAVSVMAPDRVGIIADVTEALYAMGGNIEALSQTIMHGWFTMILSVSFDAGRVCEEVERGVSEAASCRALVSPLTGGEGVARGQGEPFIISIVGEDKPGIIRRVSHFLAARNINVEDVWNEVTHDRFVMIFTVVLPPTVDPKEVRYELTKIGGDLGVSVRMQHQNIFTATNSLSVKARQ